MCGAEPSLGGRGSCGWYWLLMVLDHHAKKFHLTGHVGGGSFHKYMKAWREQQGPWEDRPEVSRRAMVAPGWTV